MKKTLLSTMAAVITMFGLTSFANADAQLTANNSNDKVIASENGDICIYFGWDFDIIVCNAKGETVTVYRDGCTYRTYDIDSDYYVIDSSDWGEGEYEICVNGKRYMNFLYA